MLILRFENDATPLEAVSVDEPDKEPEDGFVPIARVMEADDDVTVLPWASCTVICTDGEIDDPAAVFDGCTLNDSLDAVPAFTVTLVESADV